MITFQLFKTFKIVAPEFVMKPFLTITLCLLAAFLMALPEPIKTALYFDSQMLASGNLWQLVTGHWMHADGQHLLWNLLGLAVLGYIIERYSRTLLLLSLGMGVLAVDMLLLSPFSEIQRYCGLSGVLNTMLGVAFYCRWRETRSIIIPIVGALSVAKIFVEIQIGASLFTDISWPPYPLAHLAGLLATPLALLAYFRLLSGEMKPGNFKKSSELLVH